MKEECDLYPPTCLVPFMNKKRFAELTGFSEGVVEGWLDRSNPYRASRQTQSN